MTGHFTHIGKSGDLHKYKVVFGTNSDHQYQYNVVGGQDRERDEEGEPPARAPRFQRAELYETRIPDGMDMPTFQEVREAYDALAYTCMQHIEYSKSMFYFVITRDIEGKPPHETTNASQKMGVRALAGDSSAQKSRVIRFFPAMHGDEEDSIKDLVAKIPRMPVTTRIITVLGLEIRN